MKLLREYFGILCAVFSIIIAIVLRVVARSVASASTFRSIIYIILIITWSISIKRRILHKQARNFLQLVCALLLFWFLIRTIRYNIAFDTDITRYLWYLYYVPMLFIPQLAVFVSLSLGQPESSTLPKRAYMLLPPTAILILLVLTNDLHQMVFDFKLGLPWNNMIYKYGIGYWLILSWALLCAVTSILIMISKCRMPKSKHSSWIPFVPIGLVLLYTLLHITDSSFLHVIAGV